MNFLNMFGPHAHWLVRASLAATFIYHGVAKFPPDNFVQHFGFPMPVGWLVAVAEVGAGVLLMIGPFTKDLLTRLGALLVIVIMLYAIYKVHLPQGWSGMEFQVLMLATGIYFLTKGNSA